MPVLFKQMLSNRSGNFTITTALLLPVLFMTVGLALDMTELSRKRETLQQAADSSALAAASALASANMTDNDAKALALSFLKGHVANNAHDLENFETPTIEVARHALSHNAKSFRVEVDASYNVPLSGFQTLLGFSHARVSVEGVAESSTESKNPLSMYLVLDRSGSMQWVTSSVDATQASCDNYYEANWPRPTHESPCYIKKINSLKTAVSALADTFEQMDPDHELVRTGAVSYSTQANQPSPLDWGTSSVTDYVNALTASGGTNSTAAMQTAYEALNLASEDQAHMDKNGLVPTKYILFMTDGQNDNANNDTSTKTWCDSAKTAGIKIYSVAFSAPAVGRQLLSYCASGTDYYYEATSVAQLVAAFRAIGEKTSKLSNRLTQ